MRMFLWVVILALAVVGISQAQAAGWNAQSKALYHMAVSQNKFPIPSDMQPVAIPMENGKSFFLIWQPKTPTNRWIISMPGTHGFATDEYALWTPALRSRAIGLIEMQTWLGTGDNMRDYLSPYEINKAVMELSGLLGIQPGHAMLHGFSRGAANSYAVAALDHTKGKQLFDLIVANSSGMQPDYPPTRALLDGRFGQQPLAGTRWVTVCGAHDPNPQRDGCPAMRETAQALKQLNATVVMTIEDQNAGHGALHSNPVNANALLDFYLKPAP